MPPGAVAPAAAAACLAREAAGWALVGAVPVAPAAATAAQSCRRSSASQSCPAHPPWWLRKGMVERVLTADQQRGQLRGSALQE